MSPEGSKAGGALVLVVGPSGAGKDALIAGARRAMASDPRFVFPSRTITRPVDASESHDSVTPDEFDHRRERGQFVLTWQAHGLSYGLPASIAGDLSQGRIVVCNASRGVLREAAERFGDITVVHVTAPRAVLEARLRARSRDADVTSRLERTPAPWLQPPDLTIDNAGLLADGVTALVRLLKRMSRGS